MNGALIDELLDVLAEKFAEKVAARLPQAPPTTMVPVVDEWLNTQQAAKHLGMGHSTLENWRMAGTGPRYSKISGRVRYSRADLDEWMRAAKL